MQMFRQHKYLFAVAALVLVFAGCKGESPTAPSNPPTTTSGGTPPPTSGNIILAVSNPTPQVNASSTITATVTDASNQPVANGTAVEFDTTLGTFTEANAQTVIRTTTNGVATVTLTSAVVGTATVSAIVANVKKTTTVVFSAVPVNPPPPETTPVISGINPTFGRPQGGEVVTITGRNFRTPLRVLFDTGAGTTPKQATIITSTGTSISVLTPAVDLGPTAQQLVATIKVINEVGTANEIVVTGPTFTYQLTILTPKITTFTPNSGPYAGGTTVSIYGEGFQTGLVVYFGDPSTDTNAKQAQVTHIDYNRIDVISPAQNVAPATGQHITVINVNSNTRTTSADFWQWVQKSQIYAIAPVSGSALGGTTVTIDGVGFTDPVTVDIAGIRAQVLKVSGTQILARTNALASPCASVTGPIVVTNITNGDLATSTDTQAFKYLAVIPVITSVTTGLNPTVGSSVTVTVQDPGIGPLGTAVVAFKIADVAVTPTPQQINVGTGTQNFVMVIPTLTFPSTTCTVGSLSGTKLGPTTVGVTFTNTTTGCTATAPNSLTVNPPGPNTCITPPQATLVSPAQNCPTPNVSPASQSAASGTQTATITISNTGTSDLKLAAPSLSPSNATGIISPNTAQTVTAGNSVSYTVTLDPTAAGPDGATVTIGTNDPATPTMTITLCGTATP